MNVQLNVAAAAGPSDAELPVETPRDLRRELTFAMKQCTPKQRKWLRALPANHFQKWSTGEKLKLSHNSIYKWLRLDTVKTVMALQEEIDDQDSDLTRQRILAAYSAIAFADLRLLYDAGGKLKAPAEWPDGIAAAVQMVETQERKLFENGEPTGEFELVRKARLFEKKGALDFLATYKKIAGAKRIEVTGKDGEPLTAAGPPVIHFFERADKD